MKHTGMVAIQFGKPLLSVSYSNLVWNLTLTRKGFLEKKKQMSPATLPKLSFL